MSANDAKGPFFIGIDLRGTSVELGVVDDLGRWLSRHRIPNDAKRGPEDAVRRIATAVHETIRQSGLDASAVARVGLSAPGTLDVPGGRLLDPADLEGWESFPLRDKLAESCGLGVTLETAANAAAYGESWVGRARGFHSLVLLTLDARIGCGTIVNGAVIRGERTRGDEQAHLLIEPRADARICRCGRRGHLDAYASQAAVVARAQEVLARDVATSLRGRVAAGEELSVSLIADEAQKCDQAALDLLMDTARYLGIGIVSLMHTVDPTGVLLAGPMTFGGNETDLGRRFLARVKQEIDQRAFVVLAERIILDYASLDSDAACLGAAGLARREYRS